MMRSATITQVIHFTLAMLLTLCTTSRAYALEDYADAIADRLQLADKPSCLFCHARDERGLATDTPFNDALKDRGFLRRLGTPSLLRALSELEADNVDSDQDGVTDIDELSAGANPNAPDDKGLPPNDCSVSPLHHSASALWILVALSLLWLRTLRVNTSARPQRRT